MTKECINECFNGFYKDFYNINEEMNSSDITGVVFNGKKYIYKTQERTKENQIYFDFISKIVFKKVRYVHDIYIDFDKVSDDVLCFINIEKLKLCIKEFLIQHNYLETIKKFNHDIMYINWFKENMIKLKESIDDYCSEIDKYLLQNGAIINNNDEIAFNKFVEQLNREVNEHCVHGKHKKYSNYDKCYKYYYVSLINQMFPCYETHSCDTQYMTDEHRDLFHEMCKYHDIITNKTYPE